MASLEPLALAGERRGVRVVVRTPSLAPPGSVPSPDPTHISVTADVDPPLFAGLYMFTRDLVRFFGALHGAEGTMHPGVDATFLVKAYDWPRVQGLLARVGYAFAGASEDMSLVVKDRSVEVLAAGASLDAERIGALVEASARLAGELSAASERMPQRPEEIAARARWMEVAAALGLSFDPRRWQIFGKLEGVDVMVSLDGSPPGVSTTFRAKLRTPLACGIHLRRGFRQKVGFTTWKDGNPPGFAELDDLMVMDARDPERAREVLGDPWVRRTLADLARESNVVVTDRDVSLGRGGFAGRTEIRQRLEALRTLVDRMTPAMPAQGPFR